MQTSREIDVLRGLAVLGVIWSHSIYGFTYPLELNGAFWVWIFFIISGYLITENFLIGNYGFSLDGIKSFLWNRFLRIIPLYEVAILVGLLMEISAGLFESSLSDFILQALCLSPLNNTPLSGPLWAIGAIVKFYLFAVPLAYVLSKVLSKTSLMVTLWILSIVLAGFYIGVVGDNSVQPRTFIGNIHFFVLGAVPSRLSQSKVIVLPGILRNLIIISLIILAWYLSNWMPQYFWRFGKLNIQYVPLSGGSLCAILAASLVLITASSREKNVHLLRYPIAPFLRFLAWCGFYSYGIYVCHSILTKANHICLHYPPGGKRLAFLSLSLILAVISYRYIEKPLLYFRRGDIRSHFVDSRTVTIKG